MPSYAGGILLPQLLLRWRAIAFLKPLLEAKHGAGYDIPVVDRFAVLPGAVDHFPGSNPLCAFPVLRFPIREKSFIADCGMQPRCLGCQLPDPVLHKALQRHFFQPLLRELTAARSAPEACFCGIAAVRLLIIGHRFRALLRHPDLEFL
ncbi:hypothetical protein D3C75_880960 [compost metagenome]